jgi:hypothetical protein
MSFYILEIVLNHQLTRKDYYIYNNLDKIRDKLQNYLTTGTGCHETVWHGGELNIYICKNYEPMYKIDLHQKLFFILDKYPHIYFDCNNQPIAIKHDQTIITKNDAEFDEHFCVKVCNDDENIDVCIELSNVPQLTGKLLEEHEIFSLSMFPSTKLHYGHNDLEYGNDMSDMESSYENEYCDSDEVSYG